MNQQSLWFEQGEWAAIPFLEIGKELSFSRENILFQQDEKHPFVYLVLEGRIRIYLLSPNGSERHLYIVGPGNIIGESNVWAEEVYGYNASTSSSARALRIPKPAFHDIVMRDPMLIQKVLRSLSNKQSALLLQTKLMSFSDIGERVLTMLRQLASSYGIKTPKGITITIPFTHQELAYVVGSSRVSVSYVMNELCEKGIILKQKGRYTLLA
ncbi:Crp/Fnr family transcriptional regulator [Bacillus sp. UNCCL81]|uniref:Crp/Fnr family transcriptional regulator n=1 Tax=Bacillus sp. UNCCL81 TaxID=1502755 RepID=UPI0008F18D3D|nr:Crp/Fnr family transcriptional regulator [Bacillus sp. UNCCL81]SFD64647.1 CRP/FNR family transcriptional regulator, anaerobic regulatory protein [Bacillus sp. UNCCL81]